MNKIPRILFYDAKPYDQQSFDAANKTYGFEIKYFDGHLDPHTAAIASGCEVVCAFVNDRIDENVIRLLADAGIQLIALRSAGYNNVDFKAAYRHIHVVRVPRYSPYAVAEHAVALMLSLNRKIHKAYFRTREGNFAINSLLGFDMHGKTLGIIGTGAIGKCLVSISNGLGMRTLAYDKFPDETYARREGIDYVPLADLYRDADIISLHCPLTPETHHMINEDSIRQMKRGVMIINTGRGKLIKTDALIRALKDKHVGFAGLDVYEEEEEYFFEDFSAEMISDDALARLLTFPNVIITSHQGFFTKEALTNIAQTTLQNIEDYVNGKYLENEICYRCGAGDTSQCLKKKNMRCF